MKKRPLTHVRHVVLALFVGVLPVFSQEPSPGPAAASDNAQKEMQAAQDLLARATAEFEGAQQSRSISVFEEVVSRLEDLRRQGSLPTRGREMLVQARELLGRAYFNIGLQEKAAESFRALVQVQPGYVMSKEKVSPKIVDYFNAVKKALVGYLAVSSTPAGARVTLNGEFLSLTDFFPLEVLAGDYTVEVSREGYRTETRAVSIASKATETLQVDLVRTSASLFFITQPSGVEVWVDGVLKGTTSGSVSPEFSDVAKAKGLDPQKSSARTEVTNLSLGSHTVELRRKCHEPVRSTVELSEARDYDAEPTLLEESLASLQLKSEPPGAKIFVDGESMGLTPRDLEGVCSGKHHIEVKHASGRFIQDIVLQKNEGLALDCPIRPSLAFLGVVAESTAGERVIPDAQEKLIQNLSKLHSLNFIVAPPETVDRALELEKLTRKSLVPGGGGDPDVIRKVTEKLAQTLEVQGFLIAVLPEERLQRTALLYLQAAGNIQPDRWEVVFSEAASYARFTAAVDARAPEYRPWTGLITIDTLLQDGLPVLRIVPGSPAAQAGIQPGEVLLAMDTKPLKRTLDFLQAVEGRKSGEHAALQLKGPTGARNVEVLLSETPQEIPLNDPSLLYNKVMMDLRQKVDGYPGTEPAAFAQLNLAICAMHFGDFAAAHDHLLKARTELPQRPGLSQGTALYYLGLALERLGYRKEAVDAYRAASGSKDATLFNNDGPGVASLAGRRAGPPTP
jgi:tetratricopeptide (TPR) repeat protein